MTQVSYPGVYIEEVPSSVRTITNVATSITAFVDFFQKGEMNKPTDIFGMSDFQREFGNLDRRSEASFAISQFFLNGGSHAVVVRTHAAINTTPTIADVGVGQAGGAAAVVRFEARSEGEWGNLLRVEIDPRTADPTRFFNLTVQRYDVRDRSIARVVEEERFPNLTLDEPHPRYVINILEQGSRLIRAIVPNAPVAMPAAPLGNGTLGGAIPAAGLQPLLDGLGTLTAGAGRRLRLQFGTGPTYLATLETWNPGTVANLFQLASRLERAIRSAIDTATNTPAPPMLTSATVSVVGNQQLLVRAGPAGDALTGLLAISNATAPADNAATQMRLTGAAVQNVQQYPLGQVTPPPPLVAAGAYFPGAIGDDGDPPDMNALVGAAAAASDQGIYALRKADLFNILCLPCTTRIGNDTQMRYVIDQSIAFCVERRAFMLIDIPEAVDEPMEMRDWMNDRGNFRSRNSALFFPRVRMVDLSNRENRVRSFPNSGTIAGIFARTDQRGVWRAAAGVEATLLGVASARIGPEQDLQPITDAQNGVLNPLGVNCIRTFNQYGIVAWGARTLFGDDARASEWKYIPVRRLALMMEETLFRSTKWVLFEPNDELLWAKIRLNVGAYLRSLFNAGAFQNISGNPRDSYYVKCDSETTTQNDINQGIVNIEVGFAPLKPAEFVVIKIQQMPGELQT